MLSGEGYIGLAEWAAAPREQTVAPSCLVRNRVTLFVFQQFSSGIFSARAFFPTRGGLTCAACRSHVRAPSEV